MIISDCYGARSWQLPPPVDGDWVDLNREDAGLLVERLAEAGGGVPAEAPAGVEAVRLSRLDFYAGWMLCDIQISAGQGEQAPDIAQRRPVVRSYLYGPDGFTPLDGQSPAIHEHNVRHGIDLSTVEKCRSYLRFFCFFVRGELGPFELHEDGEALDLTAIADSGKQAAIAASLRPVEQSKKPSGDDRRRSLRGCVLYGEQLFDAHFLIAPTGMIEMLSDEPLVEDVRRVPMMGFDGNARFAKSGPANREENVT